MIYTSNVGEFDEPQNNIKSFNVVPGFSNPRMASRVPKMLPHLWMKEPTSVWVDANIKPLTTEFELLGRYLLDADLAVFQHPYRKSIVEEHAELKTLKQPSIMPVFPALYVDNKLFECGVILRRHNEVVQRFNEIWWSLYCRYPERDQVTFPLALWQAMPLRIQIIPGNVRNHPLFSYQKHRTKPKLDTMVSSPAPPPSGPVK
jgi:TOD1/MUCI70, glycosyltransferase-like domain